MEKKYKTVPEGNRLRIIALKDFSNVKAGDKGGLIEKEYNLNQEGDCWIYENAKVSGMACVADNAKIYGHAWVYGKAWVYGNAQVYDNARVGGDTDIADNAEIYGHAKVFGNARVCDNACAWENAKIYDCTCVSDNACVHGNARIYGDAVVCKEAEICGNVKIWSTNMGNISTSIKNNKDYVIFGNKNEFRMFPSNIKSLIRRKDISIVEKNYIKNLKTIRQLYEEI